MLLIRSLCSLSTTVYDTVSNIYCMSWLGKTAKLLFIFLFLFFSFLIGLITTRWSTGKYHMTLSQCHKFLCDGWSQMVTSHITVCHMTRVTWGPWENKCIATVVKCISSRELSENSIEFSLSNSEQRDSWLNSGHWTLDANITDCCWKEAKWPDQRHYLQLHRLLLEGSKATW